MKKDRLPRPLKSSVDFGVAPLNPVTKPTLRTAKEQTLAVLEEEALHEEELSQHSLSEQDLAARCIKSLAKLEQPNFWDIDEDIVEQIFAECFQQGEHWFDKIKSAVYKASQGRIEMIDIQPSEYKGIHVNGPARYFALVNGDEKVYGTFTPSDDPFRLQQH